MREVCSRPMATTSFLRGEGQHVFEPEIPATMGSANWPMRSKAGREFGDRRLRQAVEVLTAVDGNGAAGRQPYGLGFGG